MPSNVFNCKSGTSVPSNAYLATGSGISNFDLVLFIYADGSSLTYVIPGACVYDTNVDNRPIFGYL